MQSTHINPGCITETCIVIQALTAISFRFWLKVLPPFFILALKKEFMTVHCSIRNTAQKFESDYLLLL